MTLRPLLVSYSDGAGGAARAAYRIHRALRDAGLNSSMRVRLRTTDDPTVHAPQDLWRLRARARRRLGGLPTALSRRSGAPLRSHNWVPSRWSAAIDAAGADVVNVHWVGAETLSIADIGRIRTPLVFTLHDMWAFCGGEHYASDDAAARWRLGYPHDARSRGPDLDRWTFERKRRHWRPAHIVSPTGWLADCARNSALLSGLPVSVVPNPVDTAAFTPLDRAAARASLHLPQDARIVLFGADGGGTDRRKGFDLFLDALAGLSGDPAEARRPLLGLMFGGPAAVPAGFPVPLRQLGTIVDDAELVRIYSAADVAVVPSRQDNLAQCGTEAQACGTPVVAFRTAGMPDVAEHGVTGWLADPFSTSALAAGIAWALEVERAPGLGRAARARALRVWSAAVVAERYRSVYESAREAGRT